MRDFSIVSWPNTVLSTPTRPVLIFDDALRALIDDMFFAMRLAGGVGLAANQLGVGLSLFVYEADGVCDYAINPKLVARGNPVIFEEGCLSVPGIPAMVPRPERVVLSYQTLDGTQREQSAEGFLSRVFCHEVDHLLGKTILDYA